MRWIAIAALLAGACASDPLDDTDGTFDTWSGQRVLCGLGVDGQTVPLAQIERGVRRAIDRDQVLILFGHDAGRTIPRERVDAILADADRAGLPTLTFPELADATPRAGLVLGFDDYFVDDWYALRDVFAAHHARVTFFVSDYGDLTPAQKDELHALAADGHAIEAHGMGHRDAPDYVDQHGVASYLAVEIDPELAAMRADGFAPTTFAYPYGDRTRELDEALLTRFRLLRSLTYLDRSAINSAPCPR